MKPTNLRIARRSEEAELRAAGCERQKSRAVTRLCRMLRASEIAPSVTRLCRMLRASEIARRRTKEE
jgi:hypothetical protein